VPYSEKFKLRMIQRLISPNAPSALSLSREVGVPQPTLSLWPRRARSLSSMTKDHHEHTGPDESKSPKSRSAEQKYRLVVEAAAIADRDLGEFLRKRGLHAAQPEEWRRVVAETAKNLLAPGKKPSHGQSKIDSRRIRQFERELHRKHKALAEMAALIALKNSGALVGGRGREHSKEERVVIAGLVDEAVGGGARQESACDLLGLEARTLQRWKKNTAGDDLRAGPKSAPNNSLSAQERQQILEIANLPEHRDLSPKQIVPRLADQGRYLADLAHMEVTQRREWRIARLWTRRSLRVPGGCNQLFRCLT
jgi:transposase-like protein